MRMRGRFRRWSLVMVPGFVLAVAGACGTDAAGPAGAELRAPRFAAETLFRGLVFGEGEVAARVPELFAGRQVPDASQLTPEQLEGIETTKQFLVDEVKRRDPAFMEALPAEIQSGDPVRVAAAMDAAGAILTRIIRDVERENPALPDPGNVTGQCVAIVLLVFVVAAAVLTVAGVVNYVAAANVVQVLNINTFYTINEYWGLEEEEPEPIKGTAPDRDPASKLRRDQAALLIAQRLAV